METPKITDNEKLLLYLLTHNKGTLALPNRKDLWGEIVNLTITKDQRTLMYRVYTENRGSINPTIIRYDCFSDEQKEELDGLLKNNLTWSVVKFYQESQINNQGLPKRTTQLSGVNYHMGLHYISSLLHWCDDFNETIISDNNGYPFFTEEIESDQPFILTPFKATSFKTDYDNTWRFASRYMIRPSLTNEKEIYPDDMITRMIVTSMIQQQSEGKLWLFQTFAGHYLTCNKIADELDGKSFRHYEINLFDGNNEFMMTLDDNDVRQVWLELNNFPIFEIVAPGHDTPIHTTTSIVDAIKSAYKYVNGVTRNLAFAVMKQIDPFHYITTHNNQIVRETIIQHARYNEDNVKLFKETYGEK